MQIRLAHVDDLPKLIAISEAAGAAAHWSGQQWLDVFESEVPARLALIAWDEDEDGVRAGFLVAQVGAADWELENVAVGREFRRRGIGRELIAALLAYARAGNAERILLEVRASNEGAIRLYKGSGFQILARREGYYRDPDEDALVMVHTF
jgi:ribosomal-protein-alanine N-acetyltransferase